MYPPIFDHESESTQVYSSWKKEVQLWRFLSNCPKNKQGANILWHSIKEGSKLREDIIEALGMEQLNNENSFDNIINFLDNVYKKNEIYNARERFFALLRCKRENFKSMDEYIREYNLLARKNAKFEMCKLPSGAKGFLLLERAQLNYKDQLIVLTGVDLNGEKLDEQIEASLLKFFGKQATTECEKEMSSITLKEEDSYYTSGFSQRGTPRGQNRQQRGGFKGGRGNGGGRGYGNGRGYGSSQATQPNPKPGGATRGNFRPNQKRVNLDQYGNVVRCYTCGSKFHFSRECPDGHHVYEVTHNSEDEEEMQKECNQVEEEVYATNISSALEEVCLVAETVNCAILDSACTSTVCGEGWLRCYLDSLDCESRRKVKEFESSTKFKFGNGQTLGSLKRVHIPCTIAKKTHILRTDVVSSDLPLLLGKPTMKKMNVKLDMENDTAVVCGEEVKLECTPSGHYFIPLTKPNIEELNVQYVLHVLDVQNITDKREAVKHLHRQFGHTTARRLKSFFKMAGIDDKEYMDLIEDVTNKCEICPKWKKTPSRPVVSLPMATEFNETVAMDLKIWDKKKHIYILHMIDVYTRFSKATIIRSKESKEVIDKFMQCWVGSGLGVPEKILVDNGGEFSSGQFKDMCENLNIMEMHTAADSPFSNGICERNHAVIDEMVMKIMADTPNCRLETALAWAVNAKNSLHMENGFSPYQLVFGRNPTIPNVMCNKPPALENITRSKVMLEHLSAIHSSREAFSKAEFSGKISKALKNKIRASETVFTQGDIVYYKKEGIKEWKGPGKIIGIEGKTIVIKQGANIYRVHSNRVMLKSRSDMIDNTNESGKESEENNETQLEKI